ncbi:glycoside hydrolase family 127 protein [Candidatus Bathyarchaeota archaeon]|nr:MAG: glycoside hydrolase family 127 protein [Candidatus Bathyarchaeota archaeon]
MKSYGETFVVDTSKSPYAKLRPVPIENVHLEDSFWSPRISILHEETLLSQYRIFEETGRIFNFQRASGKKKGEFKGLYFNDSDVYKWVEAVAFALANKKSGKLYRLVRRTLSEILSAQDNDGYLDTYFFFEKKKERWSNLRDMHELYCAGHFIQAAIAYYRAVGDKEVLDAACRLADHINKVFGPDKRIGTPGHPEIEMALVELYRLTGVKEYLELAKFFIDNRGKGLIGGSPYYIDHKPFRELEEIVGHAVRSVYLNCGATDIYLETGEKALLDALLRLWHNMTERKMYVTGGIGALYTGESFGRDYELPNVTAYAETCAAIANVMWNWRMLLATGEAKFADVMELALYNGVLAGISLDGEKYFYVNPLADRGTHRRQRWFTCACCPPNIARLLSSIPGYIYSLSSKGVWIHLYIQSRVHLDIQGTSVDLFQKTRYPWDGKIEIQVQPEREATFSIYLRIPGWCRRPQVLVDEETPMQPVKAGEYLEIRRLWKFGDCVQLTLPMPIERIVCHPYVMENHDRVALKRGPLVYCVEQTDNPEFDVWGLVLPLNSRLEARWDPTVLNGVVVISGEAYAMDIESGEDLYRIEDRSRIEMRKVKFTAIPYFAWANRKPGPMTVWIRSLISK